MHFPTQEECEQYASEDISISEWCLERDRYVEEKNNVNSIWSTRAIYLMETFELSSGEKTPVKFQVVVSIFIPISKLQFFTCKHMDNDVDYYENAKLYTQVAYNAYGDKLHPVVLHSGNISDNLRHHFDGKLGFVETDDGQIEYDAVGVAFVSIFELVLCFLMIK